MDKITNNDVRKSDRQMLKSTFVIGGSSVITILLGILRTKGIALILGPSGMGLTGIYGSITKLISSICEMGIGESGVRQIAAASGTGDQLVISRTILTIRRMALFSGLAGSFLLLFFSTRVSLLTFGNSGHIFDFALLSLTLLFGAISVGQIALIQGMRRIGDLAKLSILSALFGTVFSIPMIFFFGERGIVFYLIIVSAVGVLTSWLYSRKIKVAAIAMNWRQSFVEAQPLVSLGSAFMLGSLMTAGTQYILYVLIVRHLGINAAGIYQAATTLSSVYVGIILSAMFTDFYPRLSAVSQDDHECKSLINKQVEIGLLFAIPGILATITFAPLVIIAFYSSKFMLAVDILKWQILGVFLQVVTWPVGYILRAKGDIKLFLLTSLFANGSQIALTWIGIKYFGLSGAGMAFGGMNLFYGILIYWIVRTNYKFTFSKTTVQILTIAALSTGLVFSAPYFFPETHLYINIGITMTVTLFSVKKFVAILGKEKIGTQWQRVKSYFNI